MNRIPVRFGLAAALIWNGAALSASISPETFTHTMQVGEVFRLNKSITLDPSGAAVVDIFFLADNTASMGKVIGKVKSSASDLLGTLSNTYSDPAFGVGRYFGDPYEYGEYGNGATAAYQLQQAISGDPVHARTAIDGWIADQGGDDPEGNFYALHQAATQGAPTPGGVGSGAVTGWRPGARRVIVWFGDNSSHNETIREAQTIDALLANNVVVVGMNSASDNYGIDGAYTSGLGSDANQAGDIAAATGGVLINQFADVASADVAEILIDAIGLATATLDLSFATTYACTGLGIHFECTDSRGCNDVAGGDTRSFDMVVEALAVGRYEFEVYADGVAAREFDTIVVTGNTAPVPEPQTWAMFLAGAGGLATALRRRGSRARLDP